MATTVSHHLRRPCGSDSRSLPPGPALPTRADLGRIEKSFEGFFELLRTTAFVGLSDSLEDSPGFMYPIHRPNPMKREKKIWPAKTN